MPRPSWIRNARRRARSGIRQPAQPDYLISNVVGSGEIAIFKSHRLKLFWSADETGYRPTCLSYNALAIASAQIYSIGPGSTPCLLAARSPAVASLLKSDFISV